MSIATCWILWDSRCAVAIPQHFPSKCLPNRETFLGRGKQHPLGHQVGKHRQVIVSFAPAHLVGTHLHHVVEAQPRMRRLHRAQEHPPCPRVALAEDLAGTLDRHLTHLGHCEDLELLGEVLYAPPRVGSHGIPRRRPHEGSAVGNLRRDTGTWVHFVPATSTDACEAAIGNS